ncbi:beta-ketoacyl-[acyl-carrier-protein] synthase family protein [Rahnella aceris]|jgi:3-oxoacyl-(acyl-carrier-protein) synthase
MKIRVVITAFGACTPLGNDYEEINSHLRDSISGIRIIKKFNTSTFKSKYAGLPELGGRVSTGISGRTIYDEIYLNIALDEIISHRGFSLKAEHGNTGCFIGTDEPVGDLLQSINMAAGLKKNEAGEYVNLSELYAEHYRINDFLRYDPTNVLRHIHRKIPFRGPSAIHLGLCSASLQAIGMGFKSVANGRVERAIVGGVSAKVSGEHYIGLESVDVINTDQQRPGAALSRPFDKKRAGYVPAEGAVLFQLESLESALKRGAKPLLEIVGYGTSMNASHIVKPHQDSVEMIMSMHRAMEDAGIRPEDVDMINAHGTSTVLNDFHESQAIRKLFNHPVPVTANKSLHGHMIAAAGAMETLNTLIAMNENYIPGTLNLDNKDEECEINITRETRYQQTRYCLKNSFGMGGLAASVLFRATARAGEVL